MIEAALILGVAYGFVAFVLAFLWARAVVEEFGVRLQTALAACAVAAVYAGLIIWDGLKLALSRVALVLRGTAWGN